MPLPPPDRLRRAGKPAAIITAAVIAIAAPFIGAREGTVLKTYADPVLGWSVPTACKGHTGAELRQGQTWTPEQCDEMLKADLGIHYTAMMQCVNVPLSDHEKAAWLSFSFNVGATAFCHSSANRKLNAGDHRGACAAMSDWRFVAGKDCALPQYRATCGGIVTRRAAERNLCEGNL